jgi:hypothetical protein
MAHFSTALWFDLAKGVLDGEIATAMRRHLAQRCPACEEAHRRTQQKSPAPVALVFDSFQQALPAGLRSGRSESRHLLYRTDDLTADLRLEAGARTGRLLLIGQVADTRRPGAALGPLRVAVVRGLDELVSLGSNELGEFQCELERSEDLVLLVGLDHRPVVLIPLDRLPMQSNAASNTCH